ncbi:MAG TPA: hypothetical protein PK689_06485, partial [Kiritimatiellia bacterium]|nr:hypothetical protein [Kiritimatiellia bacterium]
MKLRFSLLSLCALLAGAAAQPAAAENEAYYFPDGLLYVPCVNMQDNGGNTYTNYAAFFRKSSRSWNFKLYGLAPVATNSSSPASTNLTGTWKFTFFKTRTSFFNGTNFTTTTYMLPADESHTLTLVQTNGDITGTGTVASAKCSFNGLREGDFLAFTLMLGNAPTNIHLVTGHAYIG